MATDLTNVAVSTGYVQLLHIDGGVGGSATRVYDGDGTGTPLEISTTELVIKDGSFNLDVASHDGTNGLKLGGTLVTTSAAELNLLDGITAGTVSASKFLLVDSNKDLTGLRNLTATGTIQAANFTGTGNTQIGDAAADTVAMNATITTNLIFEGSTDNAYETTLAITDPTADRTWTIPDATDTSVGRATTDTLTNKTLTAPDINTPDIDGGTVDAITSLTVANSVDIGNYTLTANGLTIDGTFTDGTLSIASGSITSAVNGTFSGTVQAEQLTTTDDATISDQLSVDGTMTISTGSIVDSTGTISFGNENLTTTGVGTFASLDISGNADIDGTMEADAYTVDGTALNEYIADTVGAMVGSNTETGVAVTYEDGDNTLDFVLGSAQTTITSLLATDIKIGEDDQTKIDFETADEIHFYAANVEQVYLGDNIFGPQSDSDVDLGSSSVRWKDAYVDSITVTGEIDGASLDISGNADIDGTLEADAITVDGTTLAEYITDQAGGMFSSNTESGITVTFQDSDNTVDLSVDAAQTGITSLLATDIKIGEDDQTKIDFEDADKINFYAGNEKQLILEDGALYPGSDNIIDLGKSDNEFKDAFFDGTVTADAFAGPLTGAVTGNADTATLATTVTVSDSTANTNFPVVFHNESNALLDDTGQLRYNPSTGELLVPKLTVAGATTTVDTVTMNASNAIIFEGATADSNETTLSIVDPTADHTQYLVNQGGYIPVLAAATTTAISTTPEEINLIDGGTARGTTAVASGDGILINDGGTMRMTNVDTVSTYFSSHNVGGSNIVTTGALNSGSITSGFGTIDTGSSTITTTGAITGGSFVTGTLTVDDGSITDSDGAISFGDDNLSTTGTLGAGATTVTSLDLNDGNITNVGDINVDTVSSDDGNGFDLVLDDNKATALEIKEGSTAYLTFVTTDSGEKITLGKKLEAGSVEIEGSAFDINGGNIDGTAIGSASASTGAFTTISASGNVDFNGDLDVDGTANLDVVDIDGATNITVSDAQTALSITSSQDASNKRGASFIMGGSNAGMDFGIFVDAGSNVTSGSVIKGISRHASFAGELLTLDCDTSASGATLINAKDAGTSKFKVLSTGATTIKGTLDIGVNDTGHDVTFYGATSGKKMLWDESDDTLSVAGSMFCSGKNGDYNTVFGYNAGASMDANSDNNTFIGVSVSSGSMSTAENNVGVGFEALKDLTSGDQNVAVGRKAGENITSGENNVLIGDGAGDAMTDTNNVVAVGRNAGGAIDHVDASHQTLIGHLAGASLTSGGGNTLLGYEAGTGLTTGGSNVAIGYEALDRATTNATYNIAIGYQSMHGNIGTDDVDFCVAIGGTTLEGGLASTASGSVAIGYNAMASNTDGAKNIAIGYRAGEDITVGDNNVALGYQALTDGATGSNNTAIGNQALYRIQDGCNSNTAVGSLALSGSSNAGTFDHNVAVGYLAGDAITSGNKNTCIGSESDPSSSSATNQTAIGYGAQGQGDNSVTLGDAAVTAVYMAQDSGASVYCAKVVCEATSNGHGDLISEFRQSGGNDSVEIYARGTGSWGANASNACLDVATMQITGRSINAGGTINASGADYAEYETKRDDCETIEKGDVCGFDSDGKITDKWANAVTFGIKSTDPSYVGGDNWGASDHEDNRLSDEELEIERQKVDRIAYSGKVPCNVSGTSVGDYIVPIKDGTGISGVGKPNPTLEEYMNAVGVVRSIKNGTPIVVVKTV